ncbi:uracil nucleotide/cysteinyl leukotriene receptor-like [Puntigrus tetrazona]|uniref:uracil nucleotide/cysteinyl leukotriene receptor-like n=1 Tax=Puntigrus tetrazona TaxID=1606681 RepID=UPI001C8A4677|nr:uracil nucleotide/cysteinyl leukotriene receptor-like [Puntigrus tetrazona]
MNNSTLNFISLESSTNSTTDSIGLKSLDICLYSINMLFGLPAHFYIIWLIFTGTKNGVASEFFILNMSVCELGCSLNSLFCILIIFIQFSHLTTLTNFLRGLVITGSPLFHCLICVERYLAVVHPVTFLKFKPLRYRVICCTVAWIITLGSCLCCIFTVDHRYIYVWFFSLQYLLFFFIQLFCLVAVLRALKQSGPGERGREKEVENHMKKRAFRIILITIVTMVVIYVPFTIVGFSVIVTQHNIMALFYFALACNMLGCFVQPVHYLNHAGKCWFIS